MLATTYAEHTQWQRSRDNQGDADFWAERAISRRSGGRLGLPAPVPQQSDGYVSSVAAVRPSVLATNGRTPFAAAMAATAAVLSGYGADGQVEFGITASTKDHADATPIVGYYLNTLPIDLEVQPDETFADLLDRAAEMVSESLEHRSYAFASIVREARADGLIPPDVSYMLAYEQLATPRFPGGRAEQRILASGTSVADATFFVQEREDFLQFGLEYRGSVLGRADAERLLACFEAVLLDGAREPSRSIADLIAPELTSDLSGGPLPVPDETVLTALIRQVVAAPDAPAVRDAAGGSLSYRQLAVAVERLARRIDEVGPVAPRSVGVSVARSTDLIVGILAAQCVGAAYVPIDPGAPAARLEQIAEAAALDVVVSGVGGPAFGLSNDRVITLPEMTAGIDEVTEFDAELIALGRRIDRIELDQVAYTIFTSGSTGRPRGVEVTHRNLAASTAARSVWYDAVPKRFLVTSSIGFDSSIVGLFWPITSGGTVVLPSDDDVHDVDRLGALVGEHEVTHMLMVPSLYRAVLERSAPQLAGLQTVIVAGEPCPLSVAMLHHDHLPDVALVNEYGPTEATVWSTAHRLRAGDRSVPIGKPIPGTTIRVVDTHLAAVPIGVAGELLISGPGVVRGYLDDTAATAARFLELDGVRWYRTGDMVRVVDGLVEFVGRADDQLNVGGYRLEPGEIESELRRWPGVREAVVVAASDPPILVAHIEADTLDEPALRAALASRLPSAAIPRRLLRCDRLPTNTNGKIDRRAASALPIDPIEPRRKPRVGGHERCCRSRRRHVADCARADRHRRRYRLLRSGRRFVVGRRDRHRCR